MRQLLGVEVWQTKQEIVIMGRPDPEDEDHSCDAMGCPSIGLHILYRFLLPPHGECICGAEVKGLINFFGEHYLSSHVSDCPDCGGHTLHVSDESARCVNEACKYSSGVDAEGNVYKRGQIVSNNGRSIDQLRCEYFDGYSFLVG
jgi:hypothetical protein